MNKVVVGTDHYNTLWLIRSLGMGGFDVIAIIINSNLTKCFVNKSRYCNKSYIVHDLNEMISLLCSLSFCRKVPIFASGDSVAEALDDKYDLLSQKYILHHCNHKTRWH